MPSLSTLSLAGTRSLIRVCRREDVTDRGSLFLDRKDQGQPGLDDEECGTTSVTGDGATGRSRRRTVGT